MVLLTCFKTFLQYFPSPHIKQKPLHGKVGVSENSMIRTTFLSKSRTLFTWCPLSCCIKASLHTRSAHHGNLDNETGWSICLRQLLAITIIHHNSFVNSLIVGMSIPNLLYKDGEAMWNQHSHVQLTESTGMNQHPLRSSHTRLVAPLGFPRPCPRFLPLGIPGASQMKRSEAASGCVGSF